MKTSELAKHDPATTDRAVGAVLASAAGDALGAPYEFGRPDPRAPCAMEGGGGFQWEPGEWTDDTQMALAVLSVLAAGRTDPARMGDEMVRWFDSRPADVGNQTRAVLGDASRTRRPPAQAADAFQSRWPDAAGNGALMRTGPVALAALGDRPAVAELAADVSRLTHPHVDSVEACVLWSLAIEWAIMTSTPDESFDWCGAVLAGLEHVEPERHQLWRTRIAEAEGRDPADFARSNGWVVGAFQAAIAAITSATAGPHDFPCDHLANALRSAARAGGDTDTVAAIAGSLLGARWGATAIPMTWRLRLHGRRIYGERVLSGADLDVFARLATRRGRPDGHGWPGVEHHWYDTRLARHVELDGAWFGNVAGLPEAVDAGATVIVSLCRMGTADVPSDVAHHTVGLIDTDVVDNPNVGFVLLDTARAIGQLVDAGERVYVHCVDAEHRAPSVAAAYLLMRGSDAANAIERVRRALDGAPTPFLRAALADVERVLGGGAMNVAGIDVPIWVLDWTGSLCVVISLVYLFGKRMAYWHWSNASLVPYFALFLTGDQLMLAGLQVSYLVFGVHGLLLWRLEARHRAGGPRFNDRAWYRAGWVLTLAIFGYTVALTDFVDGWSGLQFVIVSLALVANWATTRTWTWSWAAWMVVNVLQAIYFAHLGLWAQFGLQFVLFAMSAVGLRTWRRSELAAGARASIDDRGARVPV